MQTAKVSILVGNAKDFGTHYLPPVEIIGKNRNEVRRAAALRAGQVENNKRPLIRGINPVIEWVD